MTTLSHFFERKLPNWAVPWALGATYFILVISILVSFRIDFVTIQYIQQ